ncbi:MAG TPA: hypothetical protein P5550_02305 [Bacteroidales bacterium]|nr:hypothetical protein [Bacteroidales bacterium]HRZ76851.1 hypothetical protein [Bacteroidales bacterium]
MPTTHDILYGLQALANDYKVFAILWHFLWYCLVVALLFRLRPQNRLLAVLMSLPLLSVSIFAWVQGNPFNGILFILSFVSVLIVGLKAPRTQVKISSGFYASLGMFMLLFGLVYPHFLEDPTWWEYLYASPAGLIPCPSLSVVIGWLLIFRGFGSSYLRLILIFLGLFYGLFGVFRLSVLLDIFLILGSAGLLVQHIFENKSTPLPGK